MCKHNAFSLLLKVTIVVICFNKEVSTLKSPLRSFMKLSNLRCKSFSPQLIGFEDCRLEHQNNVTKVMILCRIHDKPLTQIRLHLRGYRKRNVGYVPFVIDINLDWCAFLKTRNNEVLQSMFSVFENFSNFQTGCPVDIDYTYLNMTLYKDGGFSLPFKWPSGDYRLDIFYNANKAVRLLVNAYFKIDW